jgi:coenzyme F420-dependent oxidoreductase
MTAVDVHLPVAEQADLTGYVEATTRAEAAGFAHAWIPETWGRNVVPVLTRMADATDRIGLGPSILNVFSRSPALIGQTAATLQEVSDGRARIGVGSSGPIVIEGWHGASFDEPLKRVRETVEIARAVQTGETLNYDGDVFSLAGFRLRQDPPAQPAPLDAAGMGPKSVELAGRFADGWHGIVLSPEGTADRLADFDRGSDLGDRDRTAQRTMLSVTACAAEDGAEAREQAKQHLAFYVAAMGEYYRNALAEQGYGEVATEIASRWANGDREGAVAAISDELLDTFAAAGTPEEVRANLQPFLDVEGLDAVAIGFPRSASMDRVLATIEAVEPLAR